MTPIMIDSIVVIIILLSAAVSLMRGLIKEALTIINLAGASIAALFFGKMAQPAFEGWLGVVRDDDGKIVGKVKYVFSVIPADVMAIFLSYMSVFFGVFIILSLAGMAISSSVKALGLGPIDRALGLVFGVLRGWLIVFLIYVPFALAFTPDGLEEKYESARDSISVGYLKQCYAKVEKYIKDDGKQEDATDEAEEEPDPNSLKGKAKRMSEEAVERLTGGNDPDAEPKQEEQEYILRNDERETRPE